MSKTPEQYAALQAITDATKRVRQANDELTDASTELKVAQMRLAKIMRKSREGK